MSSGHIWVLNHEDVGVRSVPDDELLVLARSRPEPFEEFYRRHERAVLAYFRRRVSCAELAGDLAAETFAAALVSLRRFRPGREPAVAWLFGIARHMLLRSVERGRVEDRARRRLGMTPIEFADEQLARIDQLGSGAADDWLASLPADQAAAVARARK